MPAPCQIAFRPIKKPTVGRNGWVGFKPHVEYLKKGDRPFGAKAVEADITVEHDVEIVVRDGCRLYVDICRPTNAPGPVPAILSYSPFGKKQSGLIMMEHMPLKIGVTKEDISGLEKFEGIDPARWCARNYAVVSVDARGSGASDGVIPIMGTQEGEDGYDVVEAIAKLPWCNGNVGLAGNSHLAIVQWFIAQLNPPSLKAIAPWEGCGDLYREQFVRGGILDMSNFNFIIDNVITGGTGVEDFGEMYRRSGGLINAYWADKRPDMSKIKIPAYITGSEFSSIHTMGSLRGFMELGTREKWLRWAAYQEWHDLWSVHETNEDLMEFFDYYLHGKQNGWPEKTPKVRMSYLPMGKGRQPVQNIALPDFPLPNTDYRTMYLTPENGLSETPSSASGVVAYDSASGQATFAYKFPADTKLIGLPKAILYMSCDDLDDLCVCVHVKKLDANGKLLKHLAIPFERAGTDDPDEAPNSGLIIYEGPVGLLRASHRHIDESKSMYPQYPFHTHDRIEKVVPGTVVKLEIGIWAIGIQYDAGESISVQVSGSNPLWPELAGTKTAEETNKGLHKIHISEEYPSAVILPFVEL